MDKLCNGHTKVTSNVFLAFTANLSAEMYATTNIFVIKYDPLIISATTNGFALLQVEF